MKDASNGERETTENKPTKHQESQITAWYYSKPRLNYSFRSG